MLINLTDKNFQEEVIESNKPVVVKFETSWSGSSYLISSILESLSDEFNGYIKFGMMDIVSRATIFPGAGPEVFPTHFDELAL